MKKARIAEIDGNKRHREKERENFKGIDRRVCGNSVKSVAERQSAER